MSVELLADQLAKSKYRKIIALVGAGASCSAGIPDFRTPGSGLYDQLQHYNLPFPEAIFDLNYYQQNPLPFIHLCKEIWPGQESGPEPTLSHTFLKLLEDKQCLHRIYTQNIDGLESLAGISTDKLVECHGNFRSSSCIKCRKPIPIEDCQKTVVIEGSVPTCTECGSLVKPNIVFFGEEMPSRFQELISNDMEECDLLLILGTSLLVMPVAGIPSWVSSDCPRTLINRELVGDFIGRSGISSRGGSTTRDLFLQGDCDDSVQRICDLANWKEDIESLRTRNRQ
jgi:NAD-dependent SIR2 family protein deacetylase